MQKCNELKSDLGVTEKEAISAASDAIASLSSQASRFTEAMRKLQSSSASGYRLLLEAQLSKDRADLDVALVATSAKSSFGVYKLMRSYDAWRARALLENARRFGLAARRAIEARYVVDLSTMSGAEPFVASPALWADEVYQYDLNMPGAVGLSVGKSTGGLYPNRMLDYVGNLERFVNGFGIARPTAVARKDADVFSLPGPDGFLAADLATLPGDAGGASWAFLCPGTTPTWVGVPLGGKASNACGETPPIRAKVRFHLDPWGQVNTAIGGESYKNRYNARWTRLAVNVVGTSVLDCTKAADPLTCYSQPFLRYDLTHVGPAWITGFDQQWRALAVPLGRTDGAKALAAERWLDPLTEGFAKPYVDAVARDELIDRPLGGAYEIDFAITPEVQLDRIQRLQVLFDSSYWVRGL